MSILSRYVNTLCGLTWMWMNIIIFFRVFRICSSSGIFCEELWHKSAVNPGTECVPQFSVVSSALSVVSSALYVANSCSKTIFQRYKKIMWNILSWVQTHNGIFFNHPQICTATWNRVDGTQGRMHRKLSQKYVSN